MSNLTLPFASVYGPVKSWRFGRSLGIDPIGCISTCSFNCAYCQLGEIEVRTIKRQIFVPTEQIVRDLQAFKPWEFDVVTLSGSGEPTLALNLEEILTAVKEITQRPTVVLTNSTLLNSSEVRSALTLADTVAAKLDAILLEQLQRVNRHVEGVDLSSILAGLEKFHQEYQGSLTIQTTILFPWSLEERLAYIDLVQHLEPDEIQLNTPTRPRPLVHQLEARGNDTESLPYSTRTLKQVSATFLQTFAVQIEEATEIPVRVTPVAPL
ncbi:MULTISPECIES: radical SAM protein [Nostocales]|uniref:Radical SAM protein n=3 Tax=Nostocales TaxID=1161 RepID=A0A0C1NAY2_9CYAN|nr:radical SAM protein [Tolypothrix bouteillei]KAF3884187.1 radical SAM protein [Tolypothrix bouteillei VB521301]